MPILSLLGAGATALSAGAGAILSAINNRKAKEARDKEYERQKAENDNYFNLKRAEDYTERSDAQAVLEKQRQLLNERYKRAEATNAVVGGSDAALAQQKQASLDAMAETNAQLASQASAYKDNLEQQYRETNKQIESQHAQAESEYEQGRANAIAQAGQGLANAIGQAASSAEQNGLGASLDAKIEEKKKAKQGNNAATV